MALDGHWDLGQIRPSAHPLRCPKSPIQPLQRHTVGARAPHPRGDPVRPLRQHRRHGAQPVQGEGRGQAAGVRHLRGAGGGAASPPAPHPRRGGVAVRRASLPGVRAAAGGAGPGGEPRRGVAGGRVPHRATRVGARRPPAHRARRLPRRRAGVVRLAGAPARGGAPLRRRRAPGAGHRGPAPPARGGPGPCAGRPDDAPVVRGRPLAPGRRPSPRRPRRARTRRRAPGRGGPAAAVTPARRPPRSGRSGRRRRPRTGRPGRSATIPRRRP